MKEDKKLDGIEHWMPLFYKKKFISFFDFFNPEYLIFEHNLLNELEIFYKETIDAYSEKKELASTQIESINQPIKPELLYLEQSLLSKQLNLIKKIEFNKFISKKSNNYDLKATDNPFARPFREASAVLTFACTETSIPTYPAIPERVAPIK